MRTSRLRGEDLLQDMQLVIAWHLKPISSTKHNVLPLNSPPSAHPLRHGPVLSSLMASPNQGGFLLFALYCFSPGTLFQMFKPSVTSALPLIPEFSILLRRHPSSNQLIALTWAISPEFSVKPQNAKYFHNYLRKTLRVYQLYNCIVLLNDYSQTIGGKGWAKSIGNGQHLSGPPTANIH